MSVDDTELLVGQTTTLHLFAEVSNGVANNGIWAYALNVLGDAAGVAGMNSVVQYGSPDAGFSNPGAIGPDGLRDVYGGDGGFLADKNRGIGTPYELLAIELLATSEGNVTFGAEAADFSVILGINSGFLLQQAGPVTVDFGDGASLAVVPEPSSVALLLGSLCLAASRRRRRVN
ncbi:MAG: PEP-CTERM sorting domain-containing protein [Phycisphaerales bacterium]|nr:MAG: PEP-CTERM sorting domain-containing protein [Phycisphaerales bacterium]